MTIEMKNSSLMRPSNQYLLRCALTLVALVAPATASAHGGQADSHQQKQVELHEGYAYENCYVDLHEDLTQRDFRKFNAEFGSGFAFTSQSGPRTLGAKHVELGVVFRPTNIDDTTDAWNETWTHPGDDHFLGPVKLPILQLRVGLSKSTDLETMFSFGGSNWAIGGVGLRHALLVQGSGMPLDVSLRENVQVARGGSEWTMVSLGSDLVVGRSFELGAKAITATPYVAGGASSALGIESSDEVDLSNVVTFSPRATAGLDLGLGPARLGVEGTVADVLQWNLHVGAAF